jgi:poly(3-hydroxybutyrate) depolymerase
VSWLWLSICLLSLLGGTAQAAGSYYGGSFPVSTATFTRATLTISGMPRDVLVYRPAGVASPPVMTLFTGTGGTLDYSLLDELGREAVQAFADREGVVVLAPMPRKMTRGDWDNHSAGYYYWETATQEGTDSPISSGANSNPDLVFVQALMDEAIRAYGANPDRMYFNGFSNGAFFSYFAAAVLHARVAAFAETGGGLVLSNTTDGTPPCRPNPPAGATGAARTCLASGWNPQTCVSSGAVARPIAPGAVSIVPPGYLQANDDDDSVPFAHTCNLAHALTDKADFVARIVHKGGGHIWDEGFLQNSWDFMKSKVRARASLNGLWWNENESGWGMSVTQHAQMIFAAWYTYDQSGNATWFVIPSCPVTDNLCSGDIYSVTGGTSLLAPWNGANKTVSKAGTGTLSFSDNDTGVFSYSLNDANGTRNISRQQFGAGASTPIMDYSDLWRNAAESGWGVAVTQQYGTIFAAIYAYDAGGKPIWYVASNCVMSNNGCSGDLYQVSGGSAPTVTWNGANKQVTKVGTASFVFAESGAGTMAYTINGATGSKAIIRQSF